MTDLAASLHPRSSHSYKYNTARASISLQACNSYGSVRSEFHGTNPHLNDLKKYDVPEQALQFPKLYWHFPRFVVPVSMSLILCGNVKL